MQAVFADIVNDPRLERSIVALIVIAAVVLGLETHPDLASRYGAEMLWINPIVLAAFVLETAMTQRKKQMNSSAADAISLEIHAVREASTRMVHGGDSCHC